MNTSHAKDSKYTNIFDLLQIDIGYDKIREVFLTVQRISRENLDYGYFEKSSVGLHQMQN